MQPLGTPASRAQASAASPTCSTYTVSTHVYSAGPRRGVALGEASEARPGLPWVDPGWTEALEKHWPEVYGDTARLGADRGAGSRAPWGPKPTGEAGDRRRRCRPRYCWTQGPGPAGSGGAQGGQGGQPSPRHKTQDLDEHTASNPTRKAATDAATIMPYLREAHEAVKGSLLGQLGGQEALRGLTASEPTARAAGGTTRRVKLSAGSDERCGRQVRQEQRGTRRWSSQNLRAARMTR
jgi:hypothetical protein